MHIRSYTLHCFFRILGSIKKKIGQILVQLMTNNSNFFVTLLQRLQTSSRLFYDFDKMEK